MLFSKDIRKKTIELSCNSGARHEAYSYYIRLNELGFPSNYQVENFYQGSATIKNNMKNMFEYKRPVYVRCN